MYGLCSTLPVSYPLSAGDGAHGEADEVAAEGRGAGVVKEPLVRRRGQRGPGGVSRVAFELQHGHVAEARDGEGGRQNVRVKARLVASSM